MGVLECKRMGCDNIMCDRYSHKYGYICHECFTELVQLGYKTDIDEFMDTTKGEKEDPEISYRLFNDIFPENN